jgi:hypothetical protein
VNWFKRFLVQGDMTPIRFASMQAEYFKMAKLLERIKEELEEECDIGDFTREKENMGECPPFIYAKLGKEVVLDILETE